MKENGDGVFPLALRRAARRRAFSSSVKWRVENLSPLLLWFKPFCCMRSTRSFRSNLVHSGVSFFLPELPSAPSHVDIPLLPPKDHERR
jgi:hypothetical protein